MMMNFREIDTHIKRMVMQTDRSALIDRRSHTSEQKRDFACEKALLGCEAQLDFNDRTVSESTVDKH